MTNGVHVMSINEQPILPRGMRLNNPGNLRQSSLAMKDAPTVNGFANFETLQEGTFALVKLVASYYQFLGKRTLSDFVAHYAPATENDVMRYEVLMAQRARLNIMKRATADLCLDRATLALDFMRAIVHVEQGACDPRWRSAPEWVPLHTWIYCMEAVPMWKDQL
jgi:hypothetical protein